MACIGEAERSKKRHSSTQSGAFSFAMKGDRVMDEEDDDVIRGVLFGLPFAMAFWVGVGMLLWPGI